MASITPASFDYSAIIDVPGGAVNPTTVTASGMIKTTDATDSTSTTSASSIQTAGGASIAKSLYADKLFAATKLSLGSTTATYDITLGGDAARVIGLEANSISNAAGPGVTLRAAAAASDAVDKAGGTVSIEAGTSRGAAGSVVVVRVSQAGSSGNGLNSVAEIVRFGGSGLSINTGSTSAYSLHAYSATTGALFNGYSTIAGAASALNGYFLLGNNSTYQGVFDYNSSGSTTLTVKNTYNNASAVINFVIGDTTPISTTKSTTTLVSKLSVSETTESSSHTVGSIVTAGGLGVSKRIFSPKMAITEEGGFAVRITAGENLTRGEVVYIKIASGADGKVWKAPTSSDMPIGVVFANASADAEVLVVVAGIAYVLPESGITAARGNVIYTSTSEAGRVAQSATAPGAEHWRECGHFLDTGSGNGALTRAILHFN